jgi:hypothetical protein
LPATVQLPTGRVVGLKGRADAPPAQGDPRMLFGDAIALIDAGTVTVGVQGSIVDVRSLDLRDFHALRGILTALGWLDEQAVTIVCRNCDAPLEHRPCAAMALGPFEDRELTHPELDATLDAGVPHPIPALRRDAGGASEIVFRHLRVGEALPLFAAAADGEPLRVTPALAHAMGIVRLGGETSPKKMARALSRATDAAWNAVADLYLATHYPPRLFSIALCPACGARNDVDAPYDRELAGGEDGAGREDTAARRDLERPDDEGAPREESFPTFDVFDRRARALADEILDAGAGRGVAFVVEGGVAACDDGGEPLLGAYLPPFEGDAAHPTKEAEITVYYRTFRAVWEEDGPYDWDAELRETVEHELDHHVAYLEGDDPVEDEEREEIARETAAVVGRRALARGAVRGLGSDLAGFGRRTWPIWLLAVVATVVAIYANK